MGQKGVVIVLDEGVQVPEWITGHEKRVGISTRISKDRELPVLTIFRGEAAFIPGGYVGVRFPGSKGFRVAFKPLSVFEITNISNNKKTNNWYLCDECYMLTGEQKDNKPIPGTIRRRAIFRCKECDAEWSMER